MRDFEVREIVIRLILLAMLFAITACGGRDASPGSGGWARMADAPLALFEAQGSTVGETLYLFSGFDNDDWGNLQATPRVYAYHASRNTWTRLADMPEPLTHAGTAADGEVIYLVGGFRGGYGSSTELVWLYDTRSDSWSMGPSLPAGRGAGALVKLDRQLHYFGGVIREDDSYLEDTGDHWILDLDGDGRWREAAPLPNPRNHLGGAALGGRVYAVGGQHLGDEDRGNQADVHVYDPAEDSWREVAPLPRARGHIHTSTLEKEGRLVVLGGVEQGGAAVSSVLEYDPAADRWQELSALPAPRQAAVAGRVGERIVVATGYGDRPSVTTWMSR